MRIDDFINCDYVEREGVTDKVFDLTKPWPFPDDYADMVYASHVLEHLHDFYTFFKELHRVMKEDALAYIRTPNGGTTAAWADVTHVRPWYPGCYCFLQPGYAESVFNSQHDAWHHFFNVHVVHGFVAPDLSKVFRVPIISRYAHQITSFFPEKVHEIMAVISPLKSEASIELFRMQREGNHVPYQLHYRNRKDEWVPHDQVKKCGFSWGYVNMTGEQDGN